MSQDSPSEVVRKVQQRTYSFARGMRNAAYELQEIYNTAISWEENVLEGDMSENLARSFRHALGVYGSSKDFLRKVHEYGDISEAQDVWNGLEEARKEGPLEEFVHPADISERVDRNEPYAVMDAHEILLQMGENPLERSIYVEALETALLDFARLSGKIGEDMEYSGIDQHPLEMYLDTLKAREEKDKIEKDLNELAEDLGEYNEQIDHLFYNEDSNPQVWRWSADEKLEKAHRRYQALVSTLEELSEIQESYGYVMNGEAPDKFRVKTPSIDVPAEEALRFLENTADLQELGVEPSFDTEEASPEDLDELLVKLEE